MIDEKKLIDTLRPYYDKVLHQNISDDEKLAKHDMLSDVMVEIKGQPKIGGWIPCSERLPDKGVMNPITNDYAEYLCTVCVDGFRTVRLIKFDKDGCWVNHGMNFDKYVTAWQPLPEAYHG